MRNVGNAYTILISKPGGKRPLKWIANKQIEDVNWTQQTVGSVQ
jgi:hypothetical protein